ncbi:NAD(P)H-dependent oxidoreductase [Salisaeta longa]|uniref:NAD(P)H-dependent oxidoreductase n=1 Tax=Salisaeta longa TaxID=503170 RepID=UPI0003B39252|nr:Gfo/Idh/MocA family oxidoreductase [Salisaeta longa]
MIIVDTALKKRAAANNPIRVALIGAGYMGRAIVRHVLHEVPGLAIVAIFNRTLPRAREAYTAAGLDDSAVVTVNTPAEATAAIERGQYVVSDVPEAVVQAGPIDAVLEATGAVAFGLDVTLDAIRHGKHVVLLNAELDATLGPILKTYADDAGVILTNADGDQPGVVMNLMRFVEMTGYRPVLAGNIKGLIDPYRTPKTQQRFAEQHNQRPHMVTSFADGTKISAEMAVVANATGFGVGQRGMYGPTCAHVNDAVGLFPEDQLLDGGLVDYVLGAEPGPGVFVIGYNEDPVRAPYMSYLKMGDGPFHVFYTPYHLPMWEAPLSVARAVDFHDAVIAPQGGPVARVLTLAKRDLRAGETIDGLGGFMTYGVLETEAEAAMHNLLPIGLAEGATLTRDVPQDEALTFDAIARPAGRPLDRLWNEQVERFGSTVDA